MDSGATKNVFVIEDFPGFFSGVSKSKLPPGALVDWGEGKGTDRTRNVQLTNFKELKATTGFSHVAIVANTQWLNSIYHWNKLHGGSYLLQGHSNHIGYVHWDWSEETAPGDYYLRQDELFSFSEQFPEGVGSRMVGRFVPYRDYLYYCNGVVPPLRIYGSYQLDAAIMGGGTVPSTVVSVEYTVYEGYSDTAPTPTTYFYTLVGKFGESPPVRIPLTIPELSIWVGYQVFPILRITSAFATPQWSHVNIYRNATGSNTPQYVTTLPLQPCSFVDTLADSDLGYPLSTELGSPPVLRLMEVHGDRIFGVGGMGNPNRISCSARGQVEVWPPQFELSYPDSGTSGLIREMREINGQLYLFFDDRILRLRGYDVTDYVFDVAVNGVGCIAPRSMQAWQDGFVFLSAAGVYFFNGTKLQRLSEAVQGLLTRVTPGSTDWDQAAGCVAGDQYYLSYHEISDQTAPFDDDGGKRYTNLPNRVLIFNLVNGAIGVSNEFPFFASCSYGNSHALVLSTKSAESSDNDSDILLISDYPGKDGGVSTYLASTETNIFLADLDFGAELADRVKVLESVELVYECITEKTVVMTVYRSYPIGDGSTSGVYYESLTATPEANTSLAAWDASWTGKSYGLAHLRRAKASFAKMQGKSFNVGVRIDAGTDELRIHKMLLRYHVESGDWKGSL